MNKGKLSWAKNIELALQIASSLCHIYAAGIAHRDLHSKNILVHDDVIKIADLGLSRIVDEKQSSTSRFGGIIAYTDPYHLYDSKFKRDKIIRHLQPRSAVKNPGIGLYHLARKIIEGERETPVAGTPSDYVRLYRNCWRCDSIQRPLIEEVIRKLGEINLEDVHDSPGPQHDIQFILRDTEGSEDSLTDSFPNSGLNDNCLIKKSPKGFWKSRSTFNISSIFTIARTSRPKYLALPSLAEKAEKSAKCTTNLILQIAMQVITSYVEIPKDFDGISNKNNLTSKLTRYGNKNSILEMFRNLAQFKVEALVSDKGQTALHHLIDNDNLFLSTENESTQPCTTFIHAAQWLVNQHHIGINVADCQDLTPLNLLLKKRLSTITSETIDGMLKLGANPRLESTFCAPLQIILVQISQNPQLTNDMTRIVEIMSKLIEFKADPNSPIAPFDKLPQLLNALFPAMHLKNNRDIIMLFLKSDVDVWAKTKDGFNALANAVKLNRIDLIELLFEQKRELFSPESMKSALKLTCWRNREARKILNASAFKGIEISQNHPRLVKNALWRRFICWKARSSFPKENPQEQETSPRRNLPSEVNVNQFFLKNPV
ncbi:hypothetical protein G9A89_010100 [Geosiphon pyriformis]|nr:hypothetical protein G9A89_010100 [Geosiphon pyriformis]